MAGAADFATPLEFPATDPFSAFAGGMDAAPADRGGGRGRPRGSSKQQRIRDTLVTYYALGGLLVSRANMADGQLIMAKSADMADAWIAAAKANPQIMRALEIVTIAGPYTALIMVHLQVVNGIMDHHSVSALTLFKRNHETNETTAPAVAGKGGVSPAQQPAPAPAPQAYQPVGPSAPTDNAPPPLVPVLSADDAPLRVYPDEGLPADVDVMLRQLARETGQPYAELRDAAMLQIAQDRLARNGHVVSPGALGAPVARA